MGCGLCRGERTCCCRMHHHHRCMSKSIPQCYVLGYTLILPLLYQYVSMYLPLLLYDNLYIYRYLALAWENVAEIEYRRGAGPTQRETLRFATRGIA